MSVYCGNCWEASCPGCCGWHPPGEPPWSGKEWTRLSGVPAVSGITFVLGRTTYSLRRGDQWLTHPPTEGAWLTSVRYPEPGAVECDGSCCVGPCNVDTAEANRQAAIASARAHAPKGQP